MSAEMFSSERHTSAENAIHDNCTNHNTKTNINCCRPMPIQVVTPIPFWSCAVAVIHCPLRTSLHSAGQCLLLTQANALQWVEYTPKVAPSPGRIRTPTNTWFLGPIIAIYVYHSGLYCILFRRFLIAKINVALQLT